MLNSKNNLLSIGLALGLFAAPAAAEPTNPSTPPPTGAAYTHPAAQRGSTPSPNHRDTATSRPAPFAVSIPSRIHRVTATPARPIPRGSTPNLSRRQVQPSVTQES